MSVRLNVRVPDKQYQWLKSISEKYGVSVQRVLLIAASLADMTEVERTLALESGRDEVKDILWMLGRE